MDIAVEDVTVIPKKPKCDADLKPLESFTQLAGVLEDKFQRLDTEVKEMQLELHEADAESEALKRRLSEGKPQP